MILKMLWMFLIYFGLGLANDYLLARYYLSISGRHPFRAAGLSMLISALTMLVISAIVLTGNIFIFGGWVAGVGVGTYIGVSKK